MAENEKLPEWIDRYNRNDLNDKEKEEFLSLLEQNTSLRKEVKLDASLNEVLGEREVLNLVRKLNRIKEKQEARKVMLTIYFLAACSLFLLGLTIHYFIQWNDLRKKLNVPLKQYSLFDTSFRHLEKQIKPNQLEIDIATFDSAQARESRGDSSIRKRVRAMLAKSYDPFPPFEELVGEATRSYQFRMLTPENGGHFATGSPIEFRWEVIPEHIIKIEITNNAGQCLYYSAEIPRQSIAIDSLKLKPGLYYVKFIEQDEILYFGKFFVK